MNSRNFIPFDGKLYAFDIKRLFAILGEECPSDTTKEKIKAEEWGYMPLDDEGKDFKLLHKENSEHVTNNKETFASVKYDLYKNLMQLILNPTMDSEGVIQHLDSMDSMYFGQAIAFNTMLKDGIIIEISE